MSNPTGFSPYVIRVVLGMNATVTWTNDDTIDHTVTSDTGLFRSPIMSHGQLFTFTFAAPGNYTFGCEFHPLMKGTVVVLQPH